MNLIWIHFVDPSSRDPQFADPMFWGLDQMGDDQNARFSLLSRARATQEMIIPCRLKLASFNGP